MIIDKVSMDWKQQPTCPENTNKSQPTSLTNKLGVYPIIIPFYPAIRGSVFEPWVVHSNY